MIKLYISIVFYPQLTLDINIEFTKIIMIGNDRIRRRWTCQSPTTIPDVASSCRGAWGEAATNCSSRKEEVIDLIICKLIAYKPSL